MCRHCGKVPSNRPRGLCWSCYYTPGLRDLYPSTSKFARHGVDYRERIEPAAAPTGARPGSPEKMAILEQRARSHQSLWHPLDAPMDSESAHLGVG